MLMLIIGCSNASEAGGADSSGESKTADGADAGENKASGEGGTLNIQVDVEISTLDYHGTMEGNALEVMNNIGEGLYRSDAKGVPQLAVAESVDKSEDGLTYTFKLKDTKYSDGSSVTANDFVYSWRRLGDPALANDYNFLLNIANIANAPEVINGEKPLEELGVKALDDKTLEVRLSVPVPFFETLLAFPPFFPVSEEFVSQQGENYSTSAETIISNGPFYVTSYEPNSTTVELKKNPNYYDAVNVHLDGITYQVVKDSQQAALSYQNGDLDIIKLSGEQVDLFKDDPEYNKFLTGYLWMITPNQKLDTLSNLNLRLALATSFDKEALVNNVLKDGSVPADYLVPPGVAVDSDGRDFRETTGKYLETNKKLALEYWNKAKEELGINELTLTLLVEDSESAINTGQFIQAQVQETLPGLTLNIESMPKKSKGERTKVGDFELNLHRWGPDYADPLTFLNLWISTEHYSWSNAEYDAIVESATKGDLALKPEERWKELQRAEKIAADAAATFPVYQQGNALLVKNNIKDVDFHFAVGVNSYKNARKE